MISMKYLLFALCAFILETLKKTLKDQVLGPLSPGRERRMKKFLTEIFPRFVQICHRLLSSMHSNFPLDKHDASLSKTYQCF